MKFQGVMLAQTLKDQKKPHGYPIAYEEKIDGFRIVYLNGVGYTRGGNTYETFAPFAKALHEVVGDDVCVDTEMTAKNWNETSKLLKRINDVDPEAIKAKVKAVIFDVFRYDTACEVPYKTRRKEVLRVARDVQGVGSGHMFEAVHATIVKTPQEAATALAGALARRLEGIIAKDLNGAYIVSPVGKTRRSKLWLKEKLFKDITIVVTGSVHQRGLCPACSIKGATGDKATCKTCGATGKIDKPNLLGALIGKMADGTKVRVGGGFTLEQREELWKIRKQLIERKCDVKVQDDKVNSISARHPNFVKWRIKGE